MEEHRAAGPKPFEFVKEISQEPKGPFPLEAPIELMVSAHYESFWVAAAVSVAVERGHSG